MAGCHILAFWSLNWTPFTFGNESPMCPIFQSITYILREVNLIKCLIFELCYDLREMVLILHTDISFCVCLILSSFFFYKHTKSYMNRLTVVVHCTVFFSSFFSQCLSIYNFHLVKHPVLYDIPLT